MLLCAPVLLDGRARGQRDPERGHRRPEGGAAARHRVRRDDRHARVHRAERQVGRRRASRWRPQGSGDSYTLDGTKMFVIDGHTADLDRRRRPAPRARAATDGISFFTVDGDARGPHPHAARRRWTRPASRPGSSSTAWRPRRSASRAPAGPRCRRRSTRPRSCLPNEMVGGAQKVLDMSVEYAKVRVQFGRPIGSFQAIKHKCADMLLEVESAKSAAYYAAWAAAEDNDELPVVAEPRQGVLLGRVLPRRGREHPDPRRHRLHLGARRAPLLQAREELRDPARRRHVPPRAARAAHRDLTADPVLAASRLGRGRFVACRAMAVLVTLLGGRARAAWRSSSPACSGATPRSCGRSTTSASTSTPRAPTRRAVTTPVGAPTSVRPRCPSARRASAVDIVGTTPEHDAVSIAVVGAKHLTLLAFLTSGCGTCLAFWDVFRDGGPVEVPGDARLVCVSKDAGEESSRASGASRRTTSRPSCRARPGPTTTCPVAPFFVLVDGELGRGDRRGRGERMGAGAVDAAHRARRRRDARPQGQPQGRSAAASRSPTCSARRAPIATCSPPASVPGDPSLYTMPSTRAAEAGGGA